MKFLHKTTPLFKDNLTQLPISTNLKRIAEYFFMPTKYYNALPMLRTAVPEPIRDGIYEFYKPCCNIQEINSKKLYATPYQRAVKATTPTRVLKIAVFVPICDCVYSASKLSCRVRANNNNSSFYLSMSLEQFCGDYCRSQPVAYSDTLGFDDSDSAAPYTLCAQLSDEECRKAINGVRPLGNVTQHPHLFLSNQRSGTGNLVADEGIIITNSCRTPMNYLLALSYYHSIPLPLLLMTNYR